MRYWTFKHKPGTDAKSDKTKEIVEWAIRLNSAIMQYEYNYQDTKMTSLQWNSVLQINEGDIVFLRGDKNVHAVGKAIRPRKNSDKVLSAKKIIRSNSHGEYYSGKYNGCITFEDSPVFYLDLSEGEQEWGQRIDVDNWNFYNPIGIYLDNNDYEDNSNFAVVRQLKDEAAKKYKNLLKTKYMDNLSLSDKSFDLLKHNKNIILTGAPGTGKTHLAKELAKKLILPSDIKEEVVSKSIDSFLKQEIDSESAKRADDSWLYWKEIIKANNFNLDDFANTQANIKDAGKIKNGYYLMNFLEWKSSIYGSSKPGNAFNYGIKMNNDNKTYTIYDNKEEPVGREIAEAVFQEKIKPWIKQFLNSTLSDKIKMTESGNELIRAGQLLRKMVILDYPTEFLSIYQDATINRAYDYFIGGDLITYFEQNKAVFDFLLNKYKLEKTIESQLRLTSYIWTYFNKNAAVSYEIKEEEITEKYFIEHSEFIQFHPSYDYTDFVEGFRPIKKDDNELGFILKDGLFKQLCKKAVSDKTGSNYVIIIDEINRAEISKVFGELFFAIDPGYRGRKGMIKTQYSNMQNEVTCFLSDDDQNFFVPENVYIIGTMNDIDRSVESFDFAMRRRFTWIEIKADDRTEMLDKTIPDWKDIAIRKMQGINKVIESIEGLNSSYHIGPAYFLKLKDYEGDFSQLWQYHIEPLIKEYLRGLPNAITDLKTIKEAFNNG